MTLLLLAQRSPLGRGRHLVGRNVLVMRRQIWVILSGLFEPVFYLLSIGIGIGKLVHGIPGPGGRLVAYPTFVAPALLASSAMNGAIYEGVFNLYFKLKYAKVYDSVLATPLGTQDVVRGEMTTALGRITLYSASFVIIMTALGYAPSAWTALALPAAMLTGFAFSGMAMAATSFMRGWTDFDLVVLVQFPLFLFSATFYPLSTYPRWLQIVVDASPLYQGVAIERGLTLSALDPGMIGHAAYLALIGVLGLFVAGRRIERLLLS